VSLNAPDPTRPTICGFRIWNNSSSQMSQLQIRVPQSSLHKPHRAYRQATNHKNQPDASPKKATCTFHVCECNPKALTEGQTNFPLLGQRNQARRKNKHLDLRTKTQDECRPSYSGWSKWSQLDKTNPINGKASHSGICQWSTDSHHFGTIWQDEEGSG
jgi:hypothetical protein